MENMDETLTSAKTKVSVFGTALTYGLYAGLALILLSLLYYVFNVHMVVWLSYLNYVILIAAIIIATITYRNKLNGGFVSYGQGVAIGAILSVTVGVIMAVYLWLYFTYINVEGIQEIYEMTEQTLVEKGYSDDIIDQQMAMSSKFMKMPLLNILSLFGMAFWGTIIALLTSIFLKKSDDSFNATFNQ